MTIILQDENKETLCTLHNETGNVHVPRLKERVLVKSVGYVVKSVTSIIHSNFTTEPQVLVELKKVNRW